MKNLGQILFFAIIWILISQGTKALNLPGWATVIVYIGAVTLLIIGAVAHSVGQNFRPGLEIESIPATGMEDRRASMAPDTDHLRQMGFTKIDEFFVRISPETVVYAYKHETEPLFLYLYHMGIKKAYDVLTFFSNENGLTTSATADAGLLPGQPGTLLQIFPDAQLDTMLQQHRAAVNYLESRGLHPVTHSTEQLRRKFLEHIKRYGQRVRKIPLWPVVLIIYTFTKPGLKVHGMPIQEQVARGLVDPHQVPPQHDLHRG